MVDRHSKSNGQGQGIVCRGRAEYPSWTRFVGVLPMNSNPAVWLCIPSARPDGGTARLWKARGYRVALQRDPGAPQLPEDCFDFIWEHEWDGYPRAVNRLCREVIKQWPETLVCVTGGDDIEPDPSQDPWCIQYAFVNMVSYRQYGSKGLPMPMDAPTYAVMQPTGDPWADSQGRIIERIAGSPWFGRQWIERANGGQGPLNESFYHFFVDEHCQRAAQMQGVFWQRPDIVQMHRHWTRDFKEGGRQGKRPVRPEHLKKAQAMWDADKRVFEECKARNFSESLPLVP